MTSMTTNSQAAASGAGVEAPTADIPRINGMLANLYLHPDDVREMAAQMQFLLNDYATARQRIEGLEALGPWDDDVALLGDEAPKSDGKVAHLIRYLQTVYKRFGNTQVTASIQWGASACWVRDDQRKLIADLESRLAAVEAEREGLREILQKVWYAGVLTRDLVPIVQAAFSQDSAIRHLKEKS